MKKSYMKHQRFIFYHNYIKKISLRLFFHQQRFRQCLLLSALLLGPYWQLFGATLYFQGAFYRLAPLTLAKPVRLSAILQYAQPTATAYRPGFAFERQSEKKRQQALKQGLLDVLMTLSRQDPMAVKIRKKLMKMSATGRMRLRTSLDGVLLNSHADPLMVDGDGLFLPTLPATVRLFGWAGEHSLPYKSQYLVSDYLRRQTYSKQAERNFVYVINPNGSINQVKVAYWNRVGQRIAPGSIIYVPVANSHTQALLSDFNLKVAQFLSTQRIF